MKWRYSYVITFSFKLFFRNGKKTSFTAGSAPPYEYGYQRKSVDLQQGKRQWNKLRQNLRDESTFGTPIDDNLLNTEFDFEKNLALFDKQVSTILALVAAVNQCSKWV